MTDSMYQINLLTPGDLSPDLFSFFSDLEFENQISSAMVRVGHPDTGDWDFSWFVMGPEAPTVPNLRAFTQSMAQAQLPTPMTIDVEKLSFQIQAVPDKNWLLESYRGFPPFSIGPFFLRGSHDSGAIGPAGSIAITIDAATAFGSGEHPTTRGCIEAIYVLFETGITPARILDLGTGSGILAIAARKLWPNAAILAVDNDPESVIVAHRYADLNDCPMDIMLADTPATSDVTTHGPFDLVIANILAGPLRDLAPAICANLAPTGYLILSGLLDTQMDEVAAAYNPHHWHVTRHLQHKDWIAMTLTHS